MAFKYLVAWIIRQNHTKAHNPPFDGVLEFFNILFFAWGEEGEREIFGKEW